MELALEYARYLGLGFGRHLVLVCVLLLLGALICARLGRSLGIDRLFWHEARPEQFVAGVAAGLLYSKVAFVSSLLDQAQLRHLRLFQGIEAGAIVAAFQIVLLSVPTALVWLLLALAAPPAVRASMAVPRLPLVMGGTLGIAAGVSVLFGFARWLPAAPAIPGWLVDVLWLNGVPPTERPLHVLAAVFIAGLSAEYVVYAAIQRAFTPAVAICTLLGLITGAYGFLDFRDWNESAIALVMLAGVGLAGLPRYKLRLRALAARYASPVPLEPYPMQAQPTAQPGLELIRSEDIPWRLPGGPRRPLVLVCASGGGLRAALWTAEVLSALERDLQGFAPCMRLIAGASGGMVGAAYHALTQQSQAGAPPWPHALPRDELLKRLGSDSLSGPIKRLVLRDLPLGLLPLANADNRGDALESCWLANFGSAFECCFGDLFERERRGELPSLIFTPMLVEDGRRLLISNLDCSFVLDNEVDSGGARRLLTRSGFEFARLFADEFPTFPIRTAARLSAAFPYISPAASLPTRPRRRVVDAGYYDNYGVNVCAAWLADCFSHEQRRRWLETNVSRVLVVQIRDAKSPLQGEKLPPQRDPGPLGRGLEGLLSPLHAALSARQSVGTFRNDEQLEQLARLFDTGFEPGFMRTEIFEYGGEASLSWYLTSAERDAIHNAANQLSDQLRALQQWWSQGPEPSKPPDRVGVHVATTADRVAEPEPAEV
jgi:hypothetical protein